MKSTEYVSMIAGFDIKEVVACSYDIETEPADIEYLESVYQPPSLDDYMSKNMNWKPETKVRKFHEEVLPAHKNQFISKAALSPMTGRVCTIGITAVLEDGSKKFVMLEGEESELLSEFWIFAIQAMNNNFLMVGWLSSLFDDQFIYKRSLINKLQFSNSLVKHRRYVGFNENVFVDAITHWASSRDEEYTKLDTVAKILGVGTKSESEVTGEKFHVYYRSDDPEKNRLAVEYLKTDCGLTIDVAKALRVY